MPKQRLSLALMIAALIASPALAKDLTVKVDAKSGPWLLSMNRKMPYGWNQGPALAPRVVWTGALQPGIHVTFEASGATASIRQNKPDIGPAGAGYCGGRGGLALFPSFYIDAAKRKGCLNALIGAFINADGIVVGQPFEIDEFANVTVPAGAAAIALGLNDDNYSDNSGSLTVKVHISDATVTVEPVK